jgi:glycosyltransferase involved in cell wall biosynthesis
MTKRDSPVRVLYILDSFPDPTAGTEGQFWRLIRGLDPSRFRPAVVLLRPSEFLARELGSVPLRVLNVTRLRSPGALLRVVRAAWWARRSGFRVAHIFFNDSAIVSRRDLGFWYSRSNLPLLRMAAKFVDRAVANCKAVRQEVIQAENFPPDKVDVIYNATDADDECSGSASRAQFGVPENVPLIIIVANLRPLKRIEDGIRALALLDDAPNGRVHLLVVGEDRTGVRGGSHRDELERIARDLRVSDRVRFGGKMTDPAPVIRLADACVLCSETEGLSNTVIDYMLAGKPVVCTAVGGNLELIVDRECGRLVRVRDPADMAGALSEILRDRGLANSWGQAARARALRMFTPASTMIAQYQIIYEDLAGPMSVGARTGG